MLRRGGCDAKFGTCRPNTRKSCRYLNLPSQHLVELCRSPAAFPNLAPSGYVKMSDFVVYSPHCGARNRSCHGFEEHARVLQPDVRQCRQCFLEKKSLETVKRFHTVLFEVQKGLSVLGSHNCTQKVFQFQPCHFGLKVLKGIFLTPLWSNSL